MAAWMKMRSLTGGECGRAEEKIDGTSVATLIFIKIEMLRYAPAVLAGADELLGRMPCG